MNNKVVIGGNLKLKNTVSGQAKLNNVISGTPNISIRAGGRGGISNAVKEALLECFEHVAWIDDDGQVYYQALYDALYAKVITSITAIFEQGQAVIYDDDSLDDLKQYLTVTANYDDGTSAIITTYTLSGTLNPGTSSIQVSYENKKAYFNVTVTHRPGVVTITNTLNGCTTSNSAASMTEGDPYSATITASSGYILTGASVSITMGGVDITSSAYNNGTISIAEVTGSLVITITAVAITLASISAVYTQSGTVYDIDTLDSLKTDLVVTALYSDASTETVPSTDYTLSGTLAEGTSTITVTYEGKTATFNVTVTETPPYFFYDWLKGDGSAMINTGLSAKTYGADSYEKFVKAKFDDASADNAKLYGARNAFSKTGFYIQAVPSGQLPTTLGFCYWNQTFNTTSYDLSEAHEISVVNKEAFVDGDSVGTGTNNTTAISDATMPMTLFVDLTNSSSSGKAWQSWYFGSQPCKAKIYEFYIKDSNDDYVIHLLPAKRTADNAVGMYDTVNDQFFTNANTGSFTIGNDS